MSTPETTETPDRDQLLGRSVLVLARAHFDTERLDSSMINKIVNICGTKLYGFTDHTLTLISDPATEPQWRTLVTAGLFSSWDEQMVNDFLSNAQLLLDSTRSKGISSLDIWEVTKYIKVLGYYTELAPLGAKHAAERSLQTDAILRVTFHIQDSGNAELKQRMSRDGDIDSTVFIAETKLRALLLTSGDDRSTVLYLILERDMFDADHIASILDANIAKSLIEGAL